MVDMNNNENLIINKNNYKGYIELMKFRLNAREKFIEMSSKSTNKYIKIASIESLLVFLSSIIFGGAIIDVVFCAGVMLFPVPTLIIALVKIDAMQKKIYREYDQNIKELYNNIDTNITTDELFVLLYKTGIIETRYPNSNRYIIDKWNIEEYENKIKIEEEFEKYLEDTKYDSYVINPEITQEQYDKPKVRKLIK